MNLSDLEEVEWQQKSETSGLLGDFLGLARDDLPEESVEKKVRAFVTKWGPLWKCRRHSNINCHWQPNFFLQARAWACGWLPIEEVRDFVGEAQTAKAILDAAGELRQNGSVPSHLWQHIFPVGIPPNVLEAHPQSFLSGFINMRLLIDGGSKVLMEWKRAAQPKLILENELGFLRVVWMEIAQAVSSAHGIMQCDGCGKFYVRETRRPKRGQQNYCPGCGAKAAKRNWARAAAKGKGRNSA